MSIFGPGKKSMEKSDCCGNVRKWQKNVEEEDIGFK